MTTDPFISWLVCNEWDGHRNRLVERLVRQASFLYKSSVEEVNFSVERGFDKKQFRRLVELTFIREHKDLFIIGSTGTGKSYLVTSLGYETCQKGLKVLYASTTV